VRCGDDVTIVLGACSFPDAYCAAAASQPQLIIAYHLPQKRGPPAPSSTAL